MNIFFHNLDWVLQITFYGYFIAEKKQSALALVNSRNIRNAVIIAIFNRKIDNCTKLSKRRKKAWKEEISQWIDLYG